MDNKNLKITYSKSPDMPDIYILFLELIKKLTLIYKIEIKQCL